MGGTGGKFYDLGAGTGKVLITAALMHDFDCVVGIEVFPELHAVMGSVGARFQASELPATITTRLEMICGDFRDAALPWWEDADLVFCNTLAFDDDLVDQLVTLLCRLRDGVIILHSGKIQKKEIFNEYFEQLEFGMRRFSWGTAVLWIHRRKGCP